MSGQVHAYWQNAKAIYPGLVIAILLALAAQFISDHYGAPTMLMALLFGMVLNFLSKEKSCSPGITFTSKKILRIGVALLGIRISFDMIASLGLSVILIAVLGVIATILFGFLLGRILKVDKYFAFLTSGSVAICGASAAMAIAAILPQNDKQDERLIFTVAGVTVLSTIAMIIYPLIGAKLGLEGVDIGVFLGATIHDVAQVVGAGYSVSDETGDISTIVKLLRVAMLAPVIIIAGFLIRANSNSNIGKKPPILPVFLVGFCALVVVKSLQILPVEVELALATLSKWALISAIAAVGMKIDLSEMRKIGGTAISMIIGETIFVGLFVLILIWSFA